MNRFMILGFVIVLSLGATGCQGIQPQPHTPGISSNQTVDISIAGVENSLTLALITAKIYTDLPRCKVSGPRICSDINVVRQIRQYAIKAHDTVLVARRNQQMIGMAVSAVSEFSSILPKS